MRKLSFSLLAVAALAFAAGEFKLPKPGWNMFSKQQDIQLGQEAAKEVERQMYVVPDPQLTGYINRIGRRLVDQGGLDPSFKYYFKVVQEDSINAFALPGGPMYVHTGLIKAADNEAQIAGVLAHELSHVVLRHSTNQASKAQFTQLGAMLGGAVFGRGTLLGSLAQAGIGLGANSVLLRFSREHESQADALGAYTMARAGYNPMELARFFEKIQAQSGNMNKLAVMFIADHPNPGNRIDAIEKELPYLPRGPYDAKMGDLAQAKAEVNALPPLKKKANFRQESANGQGSPDQQAGASAPSPRPQLGIPSQFESLRASGFTMDYPSGWQVLKDNETSMTIAPKEGMVPGRNGVSVGYGIIINATSPSAGKVQLEGDTKALLQTLLRNNPGLQVKGSAINTQVSGAPALVTTLTGQSPYAGEEETDVLVTIDRSNLFQYMIFISPTSDYPRLEAVYQQITRTVRFN